MAADRIIIVIPAGVGRQQRSVERAKRLRADRLDGTMPVRLLSGGSPPGILLHLDPLPFLAFEQLGGEPKVTWRAIDGRETGEVRFEKLAADRTKVTYQLEYEPTAWEGEADTVRDWMNRRVDWDLDQFRKIVEPAP